MPPPTSEPIAGALILLVEDEVVTASVLALTLESMGHHVVVAKSWTTAVEAFSRQEFDLVLMDAILPEVDGFKLTRMLRERSVSYVPIIFLTSLNDTNSRTLGVRCGGDDYLLKPVDELDLRIRLTAMLRIRRLTRALEVRGQRLAELASIDVLTGLLNRRSFEERMPTFVQESLLDGQEITMLMIDIDHFKRINDENGHDVGDRVIASLARVLDESVRPGDLAFRMGGEEFLVVAAHDRPGVGPALAERIRAAFAAQMEHGGPAGRQTVSIGVASLDPSGSAARESQYDLGSVLLKEADQALFLAKSRGRNRVELHRASVLPLIPRGS